MLSNFVSVGGLVLRSPGEFVFQFPADTPLVGGLGLRWYGLLMATAVLVGLLLAKFLAEQRRLERDPGQAGERVEQLALLLIVTGFAGARAYYVATHWDDFRASPWSALAIWQGGIIIHGGILAAGLALYFYARFTGINGWKYADILMPSLILGQAIGRWGNFFNSEAYGSPIAADSAWPIAQFIPPEMRVVDRSRDIDFRDMELFHPIFLYESLLNLLLFALLMGMFWKKPKLKDGTWLWSYLIGYSLIRIPYEVLRVSAVAYLGNTPIKVAYLASAIGIILGVGMLVYMYRFRFDPDLEALTHWLVNQSGLELSAAENMVKRAWGIQQKQGGSELIERVTLALPNFPISSPLSPAQRQELMEQLFGYLGGDPLPPSTPADLASPQPSEGNT
ncbi:MAG: prolipoprotein diacylglyceryl transferase [Cyanobacteriota bacterium]|nr:prolipoprotein diacylglyceryl transferase [Cyanobacteriota bacterium]